MKQLDNYFKSCEAIKQVFIKKYFGSVASGVYWVGDKIGEVLAVNDYFFDVNFMVYCLKFKVSVKKMFAYKDYEIKKGLAGKTPFNLINWLKLTN